MNILKASQIYSIWDLKAHYERKTGGHWFKPDTMRFFKCRLSEDIYPGKTNIYFVSSEKGPDDVRRYSVRSYNPETGDLKTNGEFGEYKSLSGAKKGANRLAGLEIEAFHRGNV